MATLDETNIFGIPPKQPEKKDDSLSRLGISESGYLNRLAQIQQMNLQGQTDMSEARSARGAEKKVLRDQYFSDLAEAAKDPTQEKRDTALESFFETPFMFQMGQYIPDPTGLPTDIAEAEYAGRKFRESREERGLGDANFLYPDHMSPGVSFDGGQRIMYEDLSAEEAALQLQRGLAIASIPPGVGGIASLASIPIVAARSAFKTPKLGLDISEAPRIDYNDRSFQAPTIQAKTMDGQGGGGGGIGGLSKQEFTQQEIDTKARDGMFISPLNKYLITTAPKNLKGQAILDNIKSNQSKGGYKTDEIKITGIENFLKENPEATTADAIDFISENKVRVQQNVYKDNVNSSEPELFQEPELESINPITGKDDSLEFAEGYYKGMKDGDEDYRIGTGAVRSHFMDLHADGKINDSELDNVKDKITASEVRYSGIDNPELPNQYLSDDELQLLSKNLSITEYGSLAPNKIIRINDDVGHPSLGIYGNDVDGYKFFQNNSLIDTPRIQTEGEARIQMRQFMLDNSMIEGDLFQPIAGSAQFKNNYVLSKNQTLQFPGGENYEEIALVMHPEMNFKEMSPVGRGHYPKEKNLIGNMIKIDAKLADGSDTYHVLEFQSDPQQQGRKVGFDNEKSRKILQGEYSKAEKDLEQYYKDVFDLSDDEFNNLNFDSPETYSRQMIENIRKRLDPTGVARFDPPRIREFENARMAATTDDLVTEYPFGENYHELVIKNAIVNAVRDGKSSVSFPSAATILDRTGTKPAYIENLEVTRVAKPTKVDREIFDIKNIGRENDFRSEEILKHARQLRKEKRLSDAGREDYSTGIDLHEYTDSSERMIVDAEAFELEREMNRLGFELVDDEDVVLSPKLNAHYDRDDYGTSAYEASRSEAIKDTQPLTLKAIEKGIPFSDFEGGLLYNKSTDEFTTIKNLFNDAERKMVDQGNWVIKSTEKVKKGKKTIERPRIREFMSIDHVQIEYGSSVANAVKKATESGDIKQTWNSDFFGLVEGHSRPSSDNVIDIYKKTDFHNIEFGREVGGESFKTDYDKKVPKYLQKLQNEYGGKYELTELDAKTAAGKPTDGVTGKKRDYTDLEKKVLKTHVLRITPEMRDKVIKEGMASMYKGGIVNKVKSMDKPIQGNRREM